MGCSQLPRDFPQAAGGVLNRVKRVYILQQPVCKVENGKQLGIFSTTHTQSPQRATQLMITLANKHRSAIIVCHWSTYALFDHLLMDRKKKRFC